MQKNNKGLADAQEGEFILNESGTAISTDPVEGIDAPAPRETQPGNKKDNEQDTLNSEPKEKNISE